MKLTKKVITILMIICITLSLCPVSTSAKSPKKEIEKQTQGLLKAIKKYNIPKIRTYCAVNDVLHIKKKSIVKYIKKANKKYFDAEIKRIKVSGNNATVTLRVSQFSGWMVFDNALSEYNRTLSFDSNDFFDLIETYYDILLQNPEQDQELISYNLKLKFTKKNGKWKLAKSNNAFFDLLDGGLATSLEDLSKNPKKYHFYAIK